MVVSGHEHCTHLGCRRADQQAEASAADCLQTLVGRSIQLLCSLWRVALDARSGHEAVQLMCTASRGLARLRRGASSSIAQL